MRYRHHKAGMTRGMFTDRDLLKTQKSDVLNKIDGGGINRRANIKGHIMIRQIALWLAMLAAVAAPTAAQAGASLAAPAYTQAQQAQAAANAAQTTATTSTRRVGIFRPHYRHPRV